MKLPRALASFSLSLQLSFSSFGAIYYVGGPGASDSNPGSSSEPWASIQKAATVVVAGDTVNIRAGTYRETVTPSNSGTSGNPIVYQPDGTAVVTVSGADTADGGWTVHSGDIYKKAISLPVTGYNDHITSNTTLLANQVFVAGKMMIEARWPNVVNSDDLLNRNDFRRTSLGTWADTSGNDAAIPSIPGGWAGGTVWMNGWYRTETRTITSHSGTTINWSGGIIANKREYYYLTGKLAALDAENEWFYDGAQLYLRAPGSGSPTSVEVKQRNWAFDLSGRSHIVVKNLQIFAASIITNSSSTNITLDGLHAKYINHSVTVPNGLDAGGGYNDVLYSHTEETGIGLMGANSVIRNSIVEYSSDQGIVLGGGNTADNNLVHDIGYGGTYACAIAPVPHEDGQQIANNTVYRTGRSAVDFRENQNVNIEKNEFYDYGLINVDLGAIYAARQDNLTGTRIHYNWLHDSKVAEPAVGAHTGIYFDQGSGPTQCDHNVIWNNGSVSSGMDLYIHKYASGGNQSPHRIYNNTFITADGSGGILSYKNACEGALVVDDLKNNIFRDIAQNRYNDAAVHFVTITSPANNLFSTTTPTFVGSGGGGLAYRLASGSTGIDQGVVISGVTDGHSGPAPDSGAYEFNGEAWVPGYTVIGPVFISDGGSDTATQTVSITSRTAGAAIRFTTDGSIPTPTSGTVYGSPVSLSTSLTLKAIAYKAGLKDSAVTSGTYAIDDDGRVSAPAFSPRGGVHTSSQTVAIASETEGTTIRYTTDGTTPSQTVGAIYSGPVAIGSTATLRAIAYKSGMADSTVTSETYTIDFGQVVAPAFSPGWGTYESAQAVTITSATGGAIIRYTSDGTMPSQTVGTIYSGPVAIGTTTTLRAIAYKSGMTDSVVTNAIYTMNIGGQVAAPIFSPEGGTYTSAQTVTIVSATSGASIRYTVDGTTPSQTVGMIYSGPVVIGSTATLRAIAYKSGMTDSAITSATYTIILQADMLARYEFTSNSLASSDTNPGSTAAEFTAGSGYTNLSFNNNRRRVTGAGNTNFTAAQENAAGEYFSTTTTTTPGNQLFLSAFSFKAIRGTSSAASITVFAIPNGGPNHGQTLTVISGAALPLNVLTTYNASLSGAAYQGLDSIELRIVFHGSSAGISTATNEVDDVFLAGAVAAPPTVTSAATANGTYGVPFSYTIVATNEPVHYSASGLPSGLSIDSSTGVITGAPGAAGDYEVLLGATNAAGTGSAVLVLAIGKAGQGIAFPNPGAKTFGDPAFALDATASSGLAVGYAVIAGPATVSGHTVTLAGAGDVTLRASQAGDENYFAAPSVDVTFPVAKSSSVVIDLADLAVAYDGAAHPVTVTTVPANRTVNVTYDGSATAPTLPGSYAVVATLDDPDYTRSVNDTLVISITALVRHALTLNGDIDGSVQVLLPESTILNGSAMVSGDLLVPGTPAVLLNGHPIYGGTIDAAGSATPANYTIQLNSGAVLRHAVRRVDPLAMPSVAAPPSPAGTRDVTINSAGGDVGDYATLRNLTLNMNAGFVAVPPGTYGAFTANGGRGLILGATGATEPAVYNLQALMLNGGSQIQIVGPVILALASGANLNGNVGSPDHPDWLVLKVAAGGVTLNGSATFNGSIVAPAGAVTINSDSTLNGTSASDRLTLNGNGRIVDPAL